MDYIRQLGLLDPKDIKEKSITLVGAGATGSHIALMLAQAGWGNTPQNQGVLKVFDDDIVKEHNLNNQIYDPTHIGMPKVEALQEVIKRKCNFEIETHKEMVTDQSSVKSTYVFLLTDTMSSRQKIFDNCIKYSFDTDLVIETRMGLREGRVYAFSPHNGDHVKEWRDTLYSDEEADASPCGASASIITTVMFLSSLATSRVIQHFNQRYGVDNLNKDDQQFKLWNEVQFALYPESFYYRMFDENEPQLIQQNLSTLIAKG